MLYTPIDCNVSLEMTENGTDKLVDQTEYLAIVGSLMHLTAAKEVLRYLKKTKELKLVYTETSGDLHGFVDSDWAKF